MDLLRKAFADIAAGATHATVLKRSAYIRHLSYADQIDQDVKRDTFFEEAKLSGLSTNEEKLVTLRKEGKWTDAMETEITNGKRMIEGMIAGKKQQKHMPSLVRELAKQMKEEERKQQERLAAKERLIGLTCESYADRQVSDYYIHSNLFRDRELTVSLFGDDEFEYLSEPEMGQIIQDYNSAMEGCSDLNIKRLAMQGFFQNYFGLVGDNLSQFFGKPVCSLTFYQVRLLSHGCQFRNIYQTNDLTSFPKNVMDDPDLLIDYATTVRKGKEELDKQGAHDPDAIVMGVKKEDAKALGVVDQRSLLRQIATQNGGNVIDWQTKRG